MPIKLPLLMSGDFGEIRSNHFHSGIDIRTEGKEGQPVYAPADGYVSRINISAWGGGKVLYITHPDGYKTVYMHLSAFCGKTGQFVHDYQYSHQLYAFDTELPRDSIKVKKGDIVALTGNSGGSMGPHLHYEIRLAENDQTINPLYFGLPYYDPIAPTIAGIKIYPATATTTINGSNKELKIYPKASAKTKTRQRNAVAYSAKTDTIYVNGRFYTGIYTYDQMEYGANNKNGIEKIELFVDDSLFHTFQVSSFLFEETRAINAIIDYREYQRTHEYYILSRRLRGDPTCFNSVAHDYGYLLFDDQRAHKLHYRVSDYKGNTTSRTFFVRNNGTTTTSPANSSHSLTLSGEHVVYYKPYHLVREDFTMNMEAHNIYENDEVIYRTTTNPGGITQQHHVSLRHNPMPPHDRISVSLSIPDKVPQELRQKLVIVCTNGKKTTPCPSRLEGKTVTATARSWGAFALRLDTIAPTVKPSGFTENKPLRGDKLLVTIGDNLSGVEHYSCIVNGQWQMVEHDGKTSTLILNAKLLRKGTNEVTYTISDAVGNSTSRTFTVIRL